MAQFLPHATYTDAEMLSLVRAAIVTVMVAGQRYEIDGIMYTRADLKQLRELETDLEATISGLDTSKRRTNVVKFMRPQ